MPELRGGDLYSKWGFGDGDMLDELIWEGGFRNVRAPADTHLGFEHEVLARCVERHLLPHLPPGVKLERIGTCHNPIRVAGWPEPDRDELEIEGVSVEITEAQVLQIASQLVAEYASREAALSQTKE